MSELGRVLELLHGAHERYRSIRAEVLLREGAVWRTTYLPPDHIRDEQLKDGSPVQILIHIGEEWWRWVKGKGADTSVGAGRRIGMGGSMLVGLFRPAPLVSLAQLTPFGSRMVAGREGIVVRAEALSKRAATMGLSMDEPTDLVVDAERGVLLANGPLALARIEFDPDLDESAFALDVPDDEIRPFRMPEGRRFESLVEAATAVDFTVLVPARLPDGAHLEGCYLSVEAATIAVTWSCGVGHHVSVEQGRQYATAAHSARWTPLSGEEGVFLPVRANRVLAQVLVQREGIGAIVRTDLGADLCLGVALSLQRMQ